jgi:hypothetical protein
MERPVTIAVEAETLRPHRRHPATGARTRRQAAVPPTHGLCGLARISEGEGREQAARGDTELAPVHPG